MPRISRKKSQLNSHRSQLLFLETPINGAKHEYGPQLRSAIHPRTFISEKPQQIDKSSSSWVAPQFNSHETGACNRKTKTAKNHIANRTRVEPRSKQTTVCKYPPLFFEAPMSNSQQQNKNISTDLNRSARCSRTKNTQLVLGNTNVSTLKETPTRTESLINQAEKSVTRHGSSTATCSGVLKSPEISEKEAAAVSAFKRGNLTSNMFTNTENPGMPCSSDSSPNIFHLLFPPNQLKTTFENQNTRVLVEDTPERDYGLRVTWRRRKELMKLLVDKQQLSLNEVGVDHGYK